MEFSQKACRAKQMVAKVVGITENPESMGVGMPSKKKMPTEQVRIDREIVRKARMILAALYPDKSLPDFLSDLLRPVIAKELPKAKRAYNSLSNDEPE